MAFTIDESFLPATLTASPMTDDEFAHFCAQHPDLCFEMTEEGAIEVMAPTYSLTGMRNASITRQVSTWAERDKRGAVTDSSTGFVLPNGARRSPDAAWTARSKIAELPPKHLENFWHLCPDFVIELKSQNDRLPKLRRKIQEYLANGAQLAWLINAEDRTVEICRNNREPELLFAPKTVTGEAPVQGFVLDLVPVWEPLV